MATTPPASMEAYVPPESVWRLVEEVVAPSERPEIRDALGDSLIELSIDIRTEVEALLGIWRDYRQETETAIAPAKMLPEPPLLRKSLKGQIQILVESLKERATESGRDSGLSLSRQNSEVIDYVLNDGQEECSTSPIQRRPSTAFSIRDGRETPMRMTPSSDGDELSATSTVSDKVESVKDQLTYLQIDEVVQDLRSALEDEVSQLLQDISFLQGCLEEESNCRAESRMGMQHTEPSIHELRAEKSLLEKQLDEASSFSTINLINSIHPRTSGVPLSPKKLPNPLVPSSNKPSKFRPSPPSSAGNGTRQSPLKIPQPAGNSRLIGRNVNRTVHSGNGDEKMSKQVTKKPTSILNKKSVQSLRPTTNATSRTLLTSTTPSATPSNLLPSPPSSAKLPTSRISSAQRFRTRVLEARQGNM